VRHSRWEERLSPYLDGELPAGEVRLMQEHMASCAGCRARFEGMRHLSESIRGLDRTAMPADLKGALLRQARHLDLTASGGTARTHRLARARPWALASLGAVAVVTAVVIFVAPPGTRQDVGEPEMVNAQEQHPEELKSLGYDDMASVRVPAEGARGPEATMKTQNAKPRRSVVAPRRAGAPAPRPTQEQSTATFDARADQAQPLDMVVSGAAAPAQAPASGLAPESPATLSLQARGIMGRFTTELIRSGEGPASLAPIVPVVASSADAGRESGAGAHAVTAPAPPARRELTAEPAATATGAKADVASLVFLTRLDDGGRIVSAELLGAHTVGTEMVELARSLLLRSAITSHAPAAPSFVVVEVRLPVAR
jgi:negative regulator of sigma E activity